MEELRRKSIYNFLKSFEGKLVVLVTKSQLVYRTNNLLVFDDFITFMDKYNEKVMMTLEEVKQISEVRR